MSRPEPCNLVRNFLTASSLLVLVASQSTLHAAERSKAEVVINSEASGKPIDRRAALAKESDEVSQLQAGRILLDGKWLDIEATHELKLSPRIEAYRQQRDSQQLDAEGHSRMAKWCQSHQLPEMAKIHWKAVIATDVDNEQARNALGHKKIDNNWLSSDELKQAADEQKRDKKDLKTWMPKIRKLVANLQSSSAQTKIEAMKDLEKIDTPVAVSPLMYAALQLEPSMAVPIVTKIKSIRSKEACLALCEIAVSDPNSEMGRLAIQGLKEYDEHFYVPELLQMLETPIELQQELVYLPNGAMAIRRAYSRETVDTKEQVEVLKLVSVNNSEHFSIFNSAIPPSTISQTRAADGWITTHSSVSNTISLPIVVNTLNPQAAKSTKELSNMSIRRAKQSSEALNQIQRQRERNAKQVLSAISGLPADQSTETYWNWWPSFNESATNVKASSRKYIVDNTESINLTTNGSGNAEVFTGVSRSVSLYHNCLVAGTPVQTSEGLKNIEEIKVGDFITSLNVETGEMSLRPATHTTIRTAESTYLITLGDESIRVTGGHNWWVVGKGWIRSRDLTSGQFMRTGNASVQITKVEKIDSPINVYNMIVDENHTYFVGKDRLLSWDVTSLQPTLQTAPGQNSPVALVSK